MSESNSAVTPSGAANTEPAKKPLSAAELLAAKESENVPADDDGKGEYGGPKGPEPTRYGDWEKGGRCIDF